MFTYPNKDPNWVQANYEESNSIESYGSFVHSSSEDDEVVNEENEEKMFDVHEEGRVRLEYDEEG